MKKVLIISNTVGVIYKFKFELLEALLEKNYEVFLFAQNEDEDKYVENITNIGVKYIEIKMSRRKINPLKDGVLFFKYLYFILKIKPNFIYTFTIKPNLYGAFIARVLKIKSASTITGLGSAFQNENILTNFLKKIYSMSLKNSKTIFFQNQENMNFFINKNILNKSNENINLISGSGINLEKFYPMKKKRVGEKIKFLFIGRLMDEKGLREYLECAAKIKEAKKNIEFQLLGPLEEDKYEQIIKIFEELDIIKYLGVSNDIREQVKEVDCIINPSWHEGMSNVLLEAGAMKKFLIASDIPGCREIVINNKTGFTFEVKNINALERRINEYINMDESEKNKILDYSYEHIKENFNRKKVINEYLKVIREGI